MNNFTYTNPTLIQFGQGQIASLAELIDPGATILLVYGGGSIKRNGVYDQITKALGNRVLREFSGVEPNPCVETLDRAVALAREEKITFILAVGGGSVIDGCKYIAGAIGYDGPGWDILTGRHAVTDAVPLGVVLTIPATGSESNCAAIVSRSETREKRLFISPAVQPRFAIMDPDVILSLPERQVANGLVDAFVHVCEQYITGSGAALVQDGYAETLLRTIVRLAASLDERDEYLWRANLMWAANQALNGLIGLGVPGDFATHMIGHELTALFGIDHARTLAAVQPALLRSQIESKRGKLERMGRNVFQLGEGDDLAERTIEAIEALYSSVGVTTSLSAYGVNAADIEPVIVQLERHGMDRLGEHQAISLDVSREILASAL